MRKIISSLLALTLVTQISSCGYVFHPDRRGQTNSDKVDWAIVGLDAIGLVFFIVPGLIAYAVDVYSGTIYLKKTATGYSAASIEGDWSNAEIIKLDPKKISDASVVQAIKQRTGITVNYDDPRLKVYTSDGRKLASL